MGADQGVYLLSQMVWNAFVVGAPILLTTLFIGLAIAVLQVTTQLQEITLSYVPKILATGFLLILLGSWMMGRMIAFAQSLYQIIPTL